MKKGPEAQLQAAVLDYLAAKGVLAYRMNTGMAISTYKGKTRAIRYGTPGMADILAFKMETLELDGVPSEISMPIWMEIKAPNGKQSGLQKSFQEQVERHGHRYVVVRDLSDLAEVL